MKKTTKSFLVLVAAAAMVGFLPNNVAAQGRGNFDPAQFRQRQMESLREQLDVKSDESWNKLEPLITKVLDAQRDARIGGGAFGFGGQRGRGRGGSDGGAGGGDQSNNRNRFGGRPSPEAEALQKAMDDKASAEEIKTKLAKLREARKEKESALEKAQDELRKALSSRQEAGAVLAGLLK